ncbi:hypothetical protein N5A93_05185 [Roseovarius sp. EGI FJ00037]|uniref:hypothetical protein n=1 Tax=Roseovarius salincola TaxID=2978479 RepID=UPI0022A71323|nr:hypothetical protein [Roseovarius sp. EGI FJ00037]MCZ0811618.1 hypothetical protein [Roseovarius sp. EGI FJ00037]
MSFRKMALATILTTANAVSVHALEAGENDAAEAGASVGGVGAEADAGAGVSAGASVGAGGSSNADADADADAGVGGGAGMGGTANLGAKSPSDSSETSGAIKSETGAAAEAMGGLNEGTAIMSADGQVIGRVDATREAEDGRRQAVISVDESADLAASRIAVDLRSLEQASTGTVEYALSLAELRSSVNASVNANANADMND